MSFKIKVVVPASRQIPIHPMCVKMLNNLDSDKRFTIQVVKGLYIYMNRNNGILGDEDKYDYFLFVDTDISHANPVNAVNQLVDRNVNVVGGAYDIRNSDGDICAFDWVDEVNFASIKRKVIGLRKCDVVGAGFLLVKNSVFNVIDKPYFRHEFKGTSQCGEDTGFCIECARKGYHIHVDGDLRLNHHAGEGLW